MADPDAEPEPPTRLEMLKELAWVVGPIAGVWGDIKVATALYPDASPHLLLAAAVVPVLAVLYGIKLWRKRSHA